MLEKITHHPRVFKALHQIGFYQPTSIVLAQNPEKTCVASGFRSWFGFGPIPVGLIDGGGCDRPTEEFMLERWQDGTSASQGFKTRQLLGFLEGRIDFGHVPLKEVYTAVKAAMEVAVNYPIIDLFYAASVKVLRQFLPLPLQTPTTTTLRLLQKEASLALRAYNCMHEVRIAEAENGIAFYPLSATSTTTRPDSFATYADYIQRLSQDFGDYVAICASRGAIPLFKGAPPNKLRTETTQQEDLQTAINLFGPEKNIFYEENSRFYFLVDKGENPPSNWYQANTILPSTTIMTSIGLVPLQLHFDDLTYGLTDINCSTSPHAVSMSHVGTVRSNQEDRCTIKIIKDGVCLVVSDGMGGHEKGEIAAQIVVDEFTQQIEAIATTSFASEGERREAIENAVQTTLQALARAAFKIGNTDMGATLACSIIIGNILYVVHVGDSRVYHVTPEHNCLRLTQDHTLANRKANKDYRDWLQRQSLPEVDPIYPMEKVIGQGADNIICSYANNNVLVKAMRIESYNLGDALNERAEPDINSYNIEAGSWTLVCSDGLWGALGPALWDRLEEYHRQGLTIQDAARLLMEEALSCSKDNITFTLYEHPTT